MLARPPRAILFDHDGTLVESEPVHHRLWAEVLARHGATLPEELYRDHYAGMPTLANAADAARRFGLAVPVEELARSKSEATRAYLVRQGFPLAPGARAVLGALRARGLRLAVVSGGGAAVLQASLHAHGLAPCFETVVSADDVVANKPAPDGYLLALERLGLQAAECLSVEDSEHGLRASLAAGIRCIAVRTPMTARHAMQDALVRVDGLEGVQAFIERALA